MTQTTQKQDSFVDTIARAGEELMPPEGWQDGVRRRVYRDRMQTAPLDPRKPWWFTAGISGGLVAITALAISLFVIRGIEDEREFASNKEVASLAVEKYSAKLKALAVQSKSLAEQLSLEIREIDALQARYQSIMAALEAADNASARAKSHELLEEAEMIKNRLQAKRAEMMRLRSKVAAQSKAAAKAKKRAAKRKFAKCTNSSDPLCGL